MWKDAQARFFRDSVRSNENYNEILDSEFIMDDGTDSRKCAVLWDMRLS